MKTCSRCGEEKPLSEFNRQKGNRDGLQSYCRDCNRDRCRERYTRRAEEYKATHRRHYWEHRDEALERVRAYGKAHAEELNVKRRQRRAKATEAREAEREFVASVFDRSEKGRRYASIIAVNRTRLAVMDRTGVDAVREGLLRFEFTRATCEATIRALEAERRDIIGRMLKLRMAAAKQAKDAYQKSGLRMDNQNLPSLARGSTETNAKGGVPVLNGSTRETGELAVMGERRGAA